MSRDRSEWPKPDCPFCKAEFKPGDSPISRFLHKDGNPFAKCHQCGKSWPLYPREPERQQKQVPTLEFECGRRRIPTVGIAGAPVKIQPKEIQSDGKSFTTYQWEFHYPTDNLTHSISVHKSTKTGKYWQGFDPKGAVRTSAWKWKNPAVSDPDPGAAYICEGEKDALAMGQFGFLAYGFPGAEALNDTQTKWVIDDLRSNHPDVKRIRIAMDHDSAGEKGTRKAIAKLAPNYDYAIEFLTWPEGTDKGFDLGDALKAEGETFPRVLLGRTWINPFEKAANEPGQVPIPTDEQRIADDIRRTPQGYFKVNKDSREALSNCTFDVLREYSLETDGEPHVEYFIQLSKPDRTSKRFTVPGSIFAEPAQFGKKVSDQGPFFLYNGSKPILATIAEWEIEREGTLPVQILDGYGWFGSLNAYVTPHLIIRDGEEYTADSEGLIHINGKAYVVDAPYTTLDGARPDWRMSDTPENIEALSQEFLGMASNLIGDQFAGLLVVGWLASCLYSDVFFPTQKPPKHGANFPFLMATGKKGSGKTDGIGRLWRALTGFDATGQSFPESTQDYMNKSLFSLRNLPMWFDEIEDAKSKIRPGTIKAVYNRASSGKGTIRGTRSLECHGCLLLTGEQPYREVTERSILIRFPHDTERSELNRDAFLWLGEHQRELVSLAVSIMKDRTADPIKAEAAFLDEVEAWHKRIGQLIPGCNDRIRSNYAKALAGLMLFPLESSEVVEARDSGTGPFAEYLTRELKTVLDIRSEQDIITWGLELVLSDRTPVHRIGTRFLIPSGPFHQALNKVPNLNAGQFLEAFKSAPYHKGCYPEHVNGRSTRCHVLDATHPGIPPHFAEHELSDFSE